MHFRSVQTLHGTLALGKKHFRRGKGDATLQRRGGKNRTMHTRYIAHGDKMGKKECCGARVGNRGRAQGNSNCRNLPRAKGVSHDGRREVKRGYEVTRHKGPESLKPKNGGWK